MPIQVTDIETLHDYVVGVMARAEHHAKHVRAVTLAMLGGIIWQIDPGSIEFTNLVGNLSNDLCRESVSGRRYACAYDRGAGAIEIRDQNTGGTALHTFTNAKTVEEVERVFSTLSQAAGASGGPLVRKEQIGVKEQTGVVNNDAPDTTSR